MKKIIGFLGGNRSVWNFLLLLNNIQTKNTADYHDVITLYEGIVLEGFLDGIPQEYTKSFGRVDSVGFLTFYATTKSRFSRLPIGSVNNSFWYPIFLSK